ncbi:hypothetical protein BST61_g2463 [Cercospora zeina]
MRERRASFSEQVFIKGQTIAIPLPRVYSSKDFRFHPVFATMLAQVSCILNATQVVIIFRNVRRLVHGTSTKGNHIESRDSNFSPSILRRHSTAAETRVAKTKA